MSQFRRLDWTRLMRSEELSQGNRLKDFEVGVSSDAARQVVSLGCCEGVAKAVDRSLLDPTSKLSIGPDSWPYQIDAQIRNTDELGVVLELFKEIMTLTRFEGFDEAFALDFHSDPSSESNGEFEKTQVGELVNQGKYQLIREAGTALSDRLAHVARTHPRLSKATVAVSVQGTKHTFGEKLAEAVASRLGIPIIKSSWTVKPTVEAKVGRTSLELKGCVIDGDVAGRAVLVIDDVWRTGVSAKSVAAMARELGAEEVFALCCTRTLRN